MINRYQQYQPLVFLIANGIMSGSKASSTMSRCRASQFEQETDGHRFIDLDSPCHKPTKLTAVWDWMALVGLPQYGILMDSWSENCLPSHPCPIWLLYDCNIVGSTIQAQNFCKGPGAESSNGISWPLASQCAGTPAVVDPTSGVLWVALGLSRCCHWIIFWIRLQRANTRQTKPTDKSSRFPIYIHLCILGGATNETIVRLARLSSIGH